MNLEFKKRLLSSLILLPITILFIIKGGLYFNFFLTILFFIAFYEWANFKINKIYKIIGLFFLIFSFYSSYLIRDMSLIFFMFIIIICIFTDMGGYFFGKLFKGPKLTKISPNKTFSGLIGSYVLAFLISYIFIFYFGNNIFLKKTFKESFDLILFIFIISSLSQIGDLIISYFKRLSNIKNTGKIFPGHGGLLDRIDGIIFVFLIFYFIKIFFE